MKEKQYWFDIFGLKISQNRCVLILLESYGKRITRKVVIGFYKVIQEKRVFKIIKENV